MIEDSNINRLLLSAFHTYWANSPIFFVLFAPLNVLCYLYMKKQNNMIDIQKQIRMIMRDKRYKYVYLFWKKISNLLGVISANVVNYSCYKMDEKRFLYELYPHKELEIEPQTDICYMMFPHGIFCTGLLITLGTDEVKRNTGLVNCATLINDKMFYVPLISQMAWASNMFSLTKQNLETLIHSKGSSFALSVKGIFEIEDNTDVDVLSIHISRTTIEDLVRCKKKICVVYTAGENRLYKYVKLHGKEHMLTHLARHLKLPIPGIILNNEFGPFYIIGNNNTLRTVFSPIIETDGKQMDWVYKKIVYYLKCIICQTEPYQIMKVYIDGHLVTNWINIRNLSNNIIY